MTTELSSLQGTAVSATIADKELSRLTVKLEQQAAGQKKSGWEWAYWCAQIKKLFGDKNTPARESITEQFPTIGDYAKYIGVSTATIHNPAKAFLWLSAVGLMPRKETKDGKSVVDFNGFSMNTAQVIELARIPAAQFEEFEKQCEQLGVSDLTSVSSTVIRDMVKKFLGIESKSKKALTDKQTEEQTEEQAEQEEQAGEQTVQAKEVTREDALVTIVELMAKYNITIADIKKQVRA